MGRRKREPMSEGKRNIIAGLLQEYLTDIQVFGTGQKGHIHYQCH